VSFFESLNGGLETFFKELSKSKAIQDRQRKILFDELETTPYLFSSDYLTELAEDANKRESDTILDYLYRFNDFKTGEDEYLNIMELESYKSIEQDIIDRVWRS
jgi:hypothetical protein